MDELIQDMKKEKDTLRREVLRLRNQLSDQARMEMSKSIEAKLFELDFVNSSNNFLIYVNFRSEVSTISIIEKLLFLKKNVYCPKVDGQEMKFYRIDTMDDLQSGYMGILEPKIKENEGFESLYYSLTEEVKKKVVMILPGAVFDKQGNRIGYGGGFYDRYLDKYPIENTIGVCFPCQIVDEIQAESYDKRVKYVLTADFLY